MNIAPATRWRLFIVAVLIVLAWLLVHMSDVLLPLFVAIGLAFAFSPLVDWFERRGVSRTLTVAAILVTLLGLFTLLLVVVVPLITDEMQGFIHDLPTLAPRVLQRVSDFAGRYGVQVPASVHDFAKRLGTGEQRSMQPVVNAARHIFTGVAGFLIVFLDFLIVPVFFFFTCRDFPKARRYLFHLVPKRNRPYARHLAERVEAVLSGYIRGQLTVAAILGVCFSIILVSLGVRFGLFIGVLAGFLNIVPFLGQATGVTLSVLMSLVDNAGIRKILILVAAFACTNFIEGHFISPKIVGDRVGLSPLWTIIALVIGGKTAGIGGMIVAVPTAGVLKVLFGEVVLKYKSSSFYREGPAVSDGTAARISEGDVSST